MNWNSNKNRRLIKAFLSLENVGETKHFLRDLMTKDEIEEFAKRLEAAEMLSKRTPYLVIEKQTGLSSTTVARVSKWLNGPEGGYRKIISKLSHHDQHHPLTHLRRGLSL